MQKSSKIALIAPSIFDGVILHSHCALLIDGKRVDAITPLNKIPQEYMPHHFSGMLSPGFIDLQVNGGGGLLFNDAPTLTALKTILNAHYQQGTHALLPTLITADDKTIEAGLKSVVEAAAKGIEGVAGIHIEGPMINPERKGIHHEPNIRQLSESIIEQICDTKEVTRLITLAPETLDLALIEKLSHHGVIVFAGHTKASPSLLQEAVAAGLKGFTHLFNAMPQMESRAPNSAGFAISDETTFASIIHDTLHVDPLMVKLAYQSKPKGKLYLVSDAMSLIGAKEKSFKLDGQMIYLKEGKLVNQGGTLAGAHIDMAKSVLNSAEKLAIPLTEAIQLGTTYPANVLELDPAYQQGERPRFGLLKRGYTAAVNHYYQGKFEPISLP